MIGTLKHEPASRRISCFLEFHYANHLIPTGALAETAREFGVSRQLVHKLAIRKGYIVMRRIPACRAH